MDECICFVTPEHTWFRYGSAVEPGSQMEWNPDCPVHPPDTKRPIIGREDTMSDLVSADDIERLVGVTRHQPPCGCDWRACPDCYPPSYPDIGQPCAGYECNGRHNVCTDCHQSYRDIFFL